MELIINKVGYKLTHNTAILYYSRKNHFLAHRRNFQKFIPKIEQKVIEGDINEDAVDEEGYFYFTFDENIGYKNSVEIQLTNNYTLKRLFVIDTLRKTLETNYIIQSNTFDSDLTVYNYKNEEPVYSFDKYKAFNINVEDNFLVIAIRSRASLISNKTGGELSISENEITRIKYRNYLIQKKFITNTLDYPLLANKQIKESFGIRLSPAKLNYNDYYKSIYKFYEKLLSYNFGRLKIFKNGFEELTENKDYFKIERNNSNVMLFKNNHVNVNAANGFKFSGPLYVPEEKTNNLEFIFIYNNPHHANELYKCLKDGLKHFPGLESYVGVPLRKPRKEWSLKYDKINTLPYELENHLEKLKNDPEFSDSNKTIFAFAILPFNKDTSPEYELQYYYKLKEILLKENIANQFIDYHRIGLNNFHFHLPNIALAILAKLGGIPWRLNKPKNKELIIGFGEKTIDNIRFIGNTIFFDNTGEIKGIKYFKSDKDNNDLSSTIKNAIHGFLIEKGENPERVIIHYYKNVSKKEIAIIKSALKSLDLDLPFVVLEVNDTKAKDFLCFDKEYNYGMPVSGTIVTLRKGKEFLLFNNTRYENKPKMKIQEEYPIKVRLHTHSYFNLSFQDIVHLISQIYEFSRIYWKSLKQQSLPVTVSYSKMIAEYSGNFNDNTVPSSEIAQNTTWFI